MSDRTLRRWLARWRSDRLKVIPRGRPVARSERQVRQEILAVFALVGPAVGLPTLEELFPEVGRSELIEMQRRYRHALRNRRRALIHALRWTRPGAVWAQDFAEPPCRVDGVYGRLHVVRDLASSEQLLALPTEAEDASGACAAVEALFRWHGAPLVLKHDNGSAFVSEEMRELASRWGVLLLFSPPGTPSYNGSIEAGIGGLKARAHHHCARNDRTGQWSCDDVEAARLEGNATARSTGLAGPTPDTLWSRRQSISTEDRAAFRLAYELHAARHRAERGVLPGIELPPRVRACVDRVAISRALIERGYLLVRRRRIPQPITRRLWSKIS
jgi:transposase InsO family protein